MAISTSLACRLGISSRQPSRHPLGVESAGRDTNLYDLMDSAYDAQEIWDKSSALGQAPNNDAKPAPRLQGTSRGGGTGQTARRNEPAEAIRTTSEPQRSASTARSRTAMADGLCGYEVAPRSLPTHVWQPRKDQRAVDAAENLNCARQYASTTTAASHRKVKSKIGAEAIKKTKQKKTEGKNTKKRKRREKRKRNVNNFGLLTLLHKRGALLSSTTPILPYVDKARGPRLGLRT